MLDFVGSHTSFEVKPAHLLQAASLMLVHRLLFFVDGGDTTGRFVCPRTQDVRDLLKPYVADFRIDLVAIEVNAQFALRAASHIRVSKASVFADDGVPNE
jgi:hypothetical protein